MAIEEGLITKRNLFKLAGATAGALVLESFMPKEARAAEVLNDFNNLTFLVHPNNPWEVAIGSGTFWDFGLDKADVAIRKLNIQIVLERANKQSPDLTVDVPVIIPTDPQGPHVDLQSSIPDRQTAAQLFGVPGTRTASIDLPGDPVWQINDQKQAILLASPDGTLSRIRPNGAVVDTAYKSANGDQGVVLRPEIGTYKIPSGTFWLFGSNTDLGVKQIVRGQIDRGLINPYVFYAVEGRDSALGLARMFATKQELVDRFGVPGTRSATFDLSNGDRVWDISKIGGATLWPNPDGTRTRVRPNGAVIEVKGGER